MVGKREGLIKITRLQIDDPQKGHHEFLQAKSDQTDGLAAEKKKKNITELSRQ